MSTTTIRMRPQEYGDQGGISALGGLMRERGTHRPGAGRRERGTGRGAAADSGRAVIVEIVAFALVTARILGGKVREHGLHVAGWAAFTTAGFHITSAVGWAVLGVGLLWTQHLTAPAAPARE